MNYAKLNKTDIANGPGVRVSLFVSGCRIRCPGCFNPEAQRFTYGQLFTTDTVKEILEALAPDHISGLTVLGGEPLDEKNRMDVQVLLMEVKAKYPKKSVWLYTGYNYSAVYQLVIMKYIDVLVDGPFIEAQKDIGLRFRGSKNQRIIDVKASRCGVTRFVKLEGE